MEVVISESGFVDALRPRQGIEDIAKAGFKNLVVDLGMYCSSYDIENMGKDGLQDARGFDVGGEYSRLYEASKDLFKKCKNAQLNISILMAPYLNSDNKSRGFNDELLQLAKESIQLCGQIGCNDIIIRPLYVGISREKLWNVNRQFYLELAQIARERNVRILLMNQCKSVGGHLVRGICAEPEEAVKWVDQLNELAEEERFGFCMDVGICNLCGVNMYDFATYLGSRIKAVLVRDCEGYQDVAALPFTAVGTGQSSTDWLNFIRGLRKILFDGKLVLDVGTTGSAFSIMLRPQVLALTKAVADYFKWQIEMEKNIKKYSSIVLFGAGNMCRNYMKCYGAKYSPLFACDNNSDMWGKRFCGLEIKNPESLKGLPEDCVILICNMYYREIEKQLRDMEIGNPIEYFSDEYMPSFYFERLKTL